MRYGLAMNFEAIKQHWALLIASVLATAILLFVLFRLYQNSARGRLSAKVRKLRRCEHKAKDAAKAVRKAEAKLKRLQGRAQSVKPRHIEEASGLLSDARALRKIADDKVLIARNHVRKIIFEEFPPKRHESMRARFLPGDAADKRPFTIES